MSSGCSKATYQAVPLATVHHPVEDIEDLEPQIEHAVTVGKLVEVAQEDFAHQDGHLDAGFTHSQGIGVVYFGLQ